MSRGERRVFKSSLGGSLSRWWDSWRLPHPVSPAEPPSTVVSAGFLEGVRSKRQSCRSKGCDSTHGTHVPTGVSDGLKEGQGNSDGQEATRDSGKNNWCRSRDALIHWSEGTQCKGFLTEFDKQAKQHKHILHISPTSFYHGFFMWHPKHNMRKSRFVKQAPLFSYLVTY